MLCLLWYRRTVYTAGCVFVFQAEDGIRDLVRSRGLGDVYKRQDMSLGCVRPSRAVSVRALIAAPNSRIGNKSASLILSLIHI